MTGYYEFDLTGVPLDLALAVAYGDPFGRTGRTDRPIVATGYQVMPMAEGGEQVLIYRSTGLPPGATPFLAGLDASGLQAMLEAWLPEAAHPPSPDIDGSVELSWRVRSRPHTHDGGIPLCVVEPAWLEYHK